MASSVFSSVQGAVMIVMAIAASIWVGIAGYRMVTAEHGPKGMAMTAFIEIVFGTIAIALAVTLPFLYIGYSSPSDPSCQPKPTRFGVVAYNVAIPDTLFYNAQVYPATTFPAAVTAYNSAVGSIVTGLFAWNGTTIRILKSEAIGLSTSTQTGPWQVFADQNSILIS